MAGQNVELFLCTTLDSLSRPCHFSRWVATDLEKVKAAQKWPVPKSTKELRSFLVLVGYYRSFVHNFGIIAKPLTELLKKGVLFHWVAPQAQSFHALKDALISAPVLALPDFTKCF